MATKKSGKAREIAGELFPVLKQKSGSPGAGVFSREVRKTPVKTPGVPASAVVRNRADQNSETLLEQRRRLENDMEIARGDVARWGVVQQPLREAFQRADAALRQLHQTRQAGGFVSKQTMLEAYDRRMEAGHAWDPSRSQHRDALRWLEAVREELHHINHQIEKASK
jgi:hypothetical protein